MPLTLLVEDGTGITNANSFVSLATARDYAALRGVTVSADDAVLTGFLVKATDWLKQKSYPGTKTFPGEAYLPWPRTDVTYDEATFDANTVPQAIKDATSQLAVEQTHGVDLMPTVTAAGVKKEVIGPLSTEYATSSRAVTPRMPVVEAILQAWVTRRGFGLTTRRV